MATVTIENLSKAYGKKRLFQEVSVEFSEGMNPASLSSDGC